jgi:radical SAM protein with 4Fe4S-binding SPASM domain
MLNSSLTILIRPTTTCNARCEYCYLGSKKNKDFMNKNTIEVIVSSIIEYLAINPKNRINCLWHGGEPSLLPLEFWEYVEKKFSVIDLKSISMSVQSNLLSDSIHIYKWWVDHSYKVSSSLDGDYKIHGIGRKITKRTYARLLNNILEIKAQSGSFGVVCVVSKMHIKQPEEVLNFFEKLRVNVRFNKLESKNLPYSISDKEYFEFLINIGKIWLCNEDSNISVEPIETDFARIFGDRQSTCDRNFRCYDQIVAIDADGHVFPCNRFIKEPNWAYGHISERSLNDMLNIYATRYFKNIEKYFKTCISCSLKKICGGGCKAVIIKKTKSEQSSFCDSILGYFEFLKKRAERIAQ